MVTKMAQLSWQQVAELALRAGWSEADAIKAVALSKVESGLDPGAVNFNELTGDQSYGLWQINMLGTMGPARRAEFGLSTNEDLLKPEVNARVAHTIWKQAGETFTRDWPPFRMGSHVPWLGQATLAVKQAQQTPNAKQPLTQIGINLPNPIDDALGGLGGGLGDAFGEIGRAATDIAQLVKFLTDPANWRRLLWILLGILLVVLALVLFISDTVAGRVVTRLVKKTGVTK